MGRNERGVPWLTADRAWGYKYPWGVLGDGKAGTQGGGSGRGVEGRESEPAEADRRADPRAAEDGGRGPLLRGHPSAGRVGTGGIARSGPQPDEESPAALRVEGD